MRRSDGPGAGGPFDEGGWVVDGLQSAEGGDVDRGGDGGDAEGVV